MTTIGFLKLSQKFRENVEDGKYFPILDELSKVALKHNNSLPTSFSLNGLYGFSDKEIKYTLSKLYPEHEYSCKRINDNIFCVRS